MNDNDKIKNIVNNVQRAINSVRTKGDSIASSKYCEPAVEHPNPDVQSCAVQYVKPGQLFVPADHSGCIFIRMRDDDGFITNNTDAWRQNRVPALAVLVGRGDEEVIKNDPGLGNILVGYIYPLKITTIAYLVDADYFLGRSFAGAPTRFKMDDYRINTWTCLCCGNCVYVINIDCPTCGTPKE